MKYAILKVDTTGLNPDTADIVRICGIRVDGDKLETFNSYVNPGVHIPEEASNISGIHDEDVANAPYFEDIKKSFLEFLGDSPIVGHNIDFDLKFINKYLCEPLQNRSMSLMQIARAFGYTGSLRFNDMCKHYNIGPNQSVIYKTNALFTSLLEDYTKKKDNKDA